MQKLSMQKVTSHILRRSQVVNLLIVMAGADDPEASWAQEFLEKITSLRHNANYSPCILRLKKALATFSFQDELNFFSCAKASCASFSSF